MSPRSNEQYALIKDERREQIMRAALKVFATRGYAATKIGDIAAKGKISHGLVYHYFTSKEEIFYELLQRAMVTSTSSLAMMEELPASPLEKVRQTAKYILGGIENFEDSAYYFLIVVHAMIMESRDDHIKELLNTSGSSMQAMMRIIRAGQEAGEIREGDPLGMAMVFFSAIQGLAIYKLSMAGFAMPDPELLVNLVKKNNQWEGRL